MYRYLNHTLKLITIFQLITNHARSLSTAFNRSTPPSSLLPLSSPPPPPFQPKRIDHIVIRCRDFHRMFEFYTKIIGCTIDSPRDDNVSRFGGALTHLRAGDSYLDLLSYDERHLTTEGRETVASMHGGGRGMTTNSFATGGSNDNDDDVDRRRDSSLDVTFEADRSTLDHFCLRVEPFDETAIVEFMMEMGVTVVAKGQRKGADGVGSSVYVEDPEGNVVELKGPPESLPKNCFSNDAEKRKKDGGISEQHSLSEGQKSTDEALSSDDVERNAMKSWFKKEDDVNQSPRSSSDSHFAITPCTRICRYNADFFDGNVCIGCFREAFEISTWNSMSSSERYYALLDAAERCPDEEETATGVFEGSVTKIELLRQAQCWRKRE